MKNYNTSQMILLLTPFVFSFAFGLDIYIPIVPQMTEIFQTTPAMIQLTLSLFLFTTGIGQLFIGPLADRFGRKPIFYASALCFLLGSLACAHCGNIGWLIAARIISSLGACGMIVASFAVVRDLYSGEQSAKMFSFLQGAVGISPTFAPILGGYLALYLGWKSIFYCLFLVGLLSFSITKIFISETLENTHKAPLNSDIFRRYLNIFTNRQFLIFGSIAGLAEGIFFCFFSISPFIIIDLHGVPPHEFGYYFAVFGSVIALGGFASGKLCEKIGVLRSIMLGIAFMFIGGVSMILCHFFAGESLTGFLIPMAIACTGSMFALGASASGALEPFGNIAGTASAAFGALEFGISSIAGSLLMLFPATSTFPYGIAILILGGLSVLCFSLRRAPAYSGLI
jgi:MFS transporter, DHA1 family, chloramphenicol/florfenicol resistance protein